MTEGGDAAKERLWQACLQLTPPALLASTDTWYMAQGDSEEERGRASLKVEVVMQWVNETVPWQLRTLCQILDEVELGIEDTDLRASVVVAAGIHLSARRRSDGTQETKAGREVWCSEANNELALSILRHRHIGNQPDDSSPGICLDPVIVKHLLESYLKPLFMAAPPSSSINQATGRVAPPNPNLVSTSTAHTGGSLMDDEVVWKGGDPEQASRMIVLGEKVVFKSEPSHNLLRQRHRALGCFNILHICCQSIQAQKREGRLTWEEVWPLVLPPMLALLEDTSPLYRLIGARIISTTLLQDPLQGGLLLRTGVDSLFRAKLESNLTFISSRHSAALLQSSSEALIRLCHATTATGSLSLHSTPSANVLADGGKARHSQLSRLMDEGVLRVWAYAQSAISAEDEETNGRSASDQKPTSEVNDDEASDIVNATLVVLVQLTQSDALGIAIARYLDVTLDFLTVQLCGLEARLDRRKGRNKVSISLTREICAARAIAALLTVCKEAPGVRVWSAKCLSAAARVWALLQDQEKRPPVQLLFKHLSDILHALQAAQPALMSGLLARLVDLDKDTFASFVEL